MGKEPEQSASASAIGSSMSLSFSALEDTDDAHVGESAIKKNNKWGDNLLDGYILTFRISENALEMTASLHQQIITALRSLTSSTFCIIAQN